MGLFSFFGFGAGKIKSALKRGAIVIDVRTGAEYDRGHVPDAFNIPVDRIRASADRLKAANKPVIVCCNSGARSGTAVQQLKASGLKEVYNGGNWQQVLKMMEAM
ncbi:MAG: rhodanese-like domain-containing protein [Bacteroidota bacterium]